ncbi:ABC transporter substrate-binding protein [Mesorhizobium sp. ANAO-SY3R2]|uniref:ABC transporter substrate-binding protein n=1 Tax=Mesorhizobium sp. ANAO-SY3R2 TaxID=3166644 RepID=UPI0036727433
MVLLRKVVAACVALPLLGGLASAEEKTLTVWMTDSRTQYKTWLEDAAAEYKKQNPDISIKVVQMAPNDAYVKWPSSVAAGNTPDITWMFFAYAGWLHDLPGGGFAPMDDVVAELGKDKFEEASLAAWNYKDSYIGVPYTKQPFYLFWRKDLFEAAGLSAPKTWTDVVNAAKVLNKPDQGQFGITIGGKNDWTVRQNFEVVLYSNGGHLLSKTGEPAFAGPEAMDALRIYSELFKNTPPGGLAAGYTEVNRTFAQGAAAMAISLPVALSQFYEANPDKAGQVGAVIPSDEGLALTMQNNKGWAVFKNSPNVDEAKDFIKFLYTSDQYAGALASAAFGWMPLYKDPAAIERFFTASDVTKAFPDAVDALLAPASGYYAGIDWFGQNPNGGEVGSSGLVEHNLNSFLAGQISAEATAENIQNGLGKIFRK